MGFRFRELGYKLGELPIGHYNAITDVPGVLVGHQSIVEGKTSRDPARRAINSGVTAILPHGGDLLRDRVPAAFDMLNGAGEVTGREFIEEMGVLDGPIMLTGSFNVAKVMDAMITESIARNPEIGQGSLFVHPCVAECSDARLSDLNARPMGHAEVRAVWSTAASGPVAEGSVGAGTGTCSFQFKAGIGTSSRIVTMPGGEYTVGVLVQANTGTRELLRIMGVPVGQLSRAPKQSWVQEGSIIVVVATDAPLLQRQLKRMAKRTHMGLARTGAVATNGSGDFAIAFSTGNRYQLGAEHHDLRDIDNNSMSLFFQAAAEATEEAVINAVCAADDFAGRDGNTAYALKREELAEMLANTNVRAS